MAAVQGETSAGSCTPWLDELGVLCRSAGALLLVDAVCTLSTMPLPMDAWGLDVVVTGGQKGLSSVPGVSLIALSEAGLGSGCWLRPRPIPHWVFDLQRAWAFWGESRYHYTAPVPGLLALHAALRHICLEGLPARFERHRRSSQALQLALDALELELFAPARDPAAERAGGVDAGGCGRGAHAGLHGSATTTCRSRAPSVWTSSASDRWGSSVAPRRSCATVEALGAALALQGHGSGPRAGLVALERGLG